MTRHKIAPVSEVDTLREQLRDRGYLSHGIERWFALDPWSSRTFWVELAIVAAKAATLIALFGALPNVAIMLIRNRPLAAVETLELFVHYAITWGLLSFAIIVVTALLLKIRPELPIDTPRALLLISILGSGLLAIPFALWWYRFDTPPTAMELIAGGVLSAIYFVVTAIVISAALLSFSIYEVQRVPAFHQKPRTVPLTVAAAVLLAILFVPAYATPEQAAATPVQVVTTPTQRRIALIAVDGLTFDIAQSRPDLVRQFESTAAIRGVPGKSTSERWASVGTGVPAPLHGVRSVDGVRLIGGSHVLQSVSRVDFILLAIAPELGAARREPLPPTVRRRDYIWEIFGGRGLSSLAVNWWTSESTRSGALTSIGQETIFNADPLRVDALASRRFLAAIDQQQPQFATVYLPALDVVLNRIPADRSRQLALSLRVLDSIASTVASVRSRGYEVLLVGLPGNGGSAILGATFAMPRPATAFDVAPMLCGLLGFPASEEMPGGTSERPRIASYGSRAASHAPTRLDQEYYESLRSLGYIR